MDKKHLIISVLIVLPFLGIEMSPIANSWITSIIIWIIFVTLLGIYNKKFLGERIKLRVRSPFFSTNPHNVIVTSQPQKTTRRRLTHDGVLWEAGGNNVWGNMDIIGPLCPKDYTPLSTKRYDKIIANLSYDTIVSSSEYNSRLFCLECHTEYTLGDDSKSIQASHNEVGVRFVGLRKREQEN
ncbi:hypothetical protein ACFLUJ_04020 [Chloroflexota bacterium]